jgi:hypothetical protein
MAETLSSDEVRDLVENGESTVDEDALLREAAIRAAQESVLPVPITIVTSTGRRFSTDPEAGPQSAYLGTDGQIGLLATGKFQDTNSDETPGDLIFPWTSVEYVILHDPEDEGADD